VRAAKQAVQAVAVAVEDVLRPVGSLLASHPRVQPRSIGR
jgi:hypothetical protein